MERKRRTQDERSAATRGALLDAGRGLFGERGYAAVGTEELVRAAGVTRGALYHQFKDKAALFEAVFEAVEQEVTQRVATEALGAGAADPLSALRHGAQVFLDACATPEVERIVLLDAPAVLGWERWREIGMQHGLGIVLATLQAGMEAGAVRGQPVEPLAHALLGALDELAMWVARAPDREAARDQAMGTVDGLLAALAP
ncbi:TetR/AcrR family transcriptional regulator [Conexibacter sp. SYSU D00693]|uniref:TetR/AcrR family transcriptional regulator n=1 Tax=Conexibacter sp. SYSU D00693 TaxID=2812560 RepID=UPI00196A4214|nr:TetR/AcrR family transcriptional regulator [Conexibacter sp. SYSU D00693]